MNQALLKTLEIDKLPQQTRLHIAFQAFTELSALLLFLKKQPGAGWICWSSTVSERCLLADIPEGRYLLSADALLTPNQSISVRQTQQGWGVWTYTEGTGEMVLSEETAYVGIEGGKHCWKVFWKAVKEGPSNAQIDIYHPFAARYLGKV